MSRGKMIKEGGGGVVVVDGLPGQLSLQEH